MRETKRGRDIQKYRETEKESERQKEINRATGEKKRERWTDRWNSDRVNQKDRNRGETREGETNRY